MSTPRTILIAAGGTGGHIMPGLAVAHELRQRGWRVVWAGHPDKMEGRLVSERGIELMPLRFSGVRGKGIVTLLKLPYRLLSGLMQASRALSRSHADVVLGMGGYVALPVGMMAALRRVPLVLHEQNAVAGMTNKVLARIADRVLSGFPDVLPQAEMVGNPVRQDLASLPAPPSRYRARTGPLRLLVVGGSLGAQALNQIVPLALARLPLERRPLVTHQSGQTHIDALRATYTQAGVAAECLPFIDDMAGALAAADVVVCRAGAMTVAEVAAAGVAALFVPLPHAVDDHQTANARFLSDANAAWLRAQAELTPEWLASWLMTLDREQLCAVALRARERALPESAHRIAAVCARMAGEQL